MPRNVPALLAADLAKAGKTLCYLLKIMPKQADTFGLTSGNIDVTYDDGTGALTYRAKRGYTRTDIDTKADMSVDNAEAQGLLAQYPFDGMTLDAVQRGDYDGAKFVQYLVNYEALSHGHVIINSGRVGQVTSTDGLGVTIELRSLTQILKQNNLIELTSITDRASYGDARNKMTLRWYASSVDTVGAESDRVFTFATIPGFPDDPGATTGTVADVQFFVGDGTTTLAQLRDTAGQSITSGFTVTSITSDSAGVLTEGTDYTVSGTGLVTFTPARASGEIMTWAGTLPIYPDGFFTPGVVHWLTGANAGRENEVESYAAATGEVTLVIPTDEPIEPGDTFKIRQDTDHSWARAITNGNQLNFRGEPFIPRANGTDLQAPTPSAS